MADRDGDMRAGEHGAAAHRDDLHATVARRLRAARQRYTDGRRVLVEVLSTTDRPLSISEILDHNAELSQSSAYRNLQILEQAGTVRRIVTASDTGARFELDEELTSHHHHLVCRVCGTVEDFRVSSELETTFEKLMSRVGRERRFRPEQHRLELVGTCRECS